MNQELALVDSNVLVYALFADSQQHESSLRLLERAQDGEVLLCVAPQNLMEFYAVITDSRRVNAPYTTAEGLDALEKIKAMPGVSQLTVPIDVLDRVVALVKSHPVSRGGVFDAYLAATMLGNGVSRIYTFDQGDFRRFPEIEVLAFRG